MPTTVTVVLVTTEEVIVRPGLVIVLLASDLRIYSLINCSSSITSFL